MFILTIPPRPLLLPTQLSPTQYLFRLPPTPPFNTLTLSLDPTSSIPTTHAAAIYYALPSTPTTFRFLGYLGQGRASGTYRIISPEVNPTSSSSSTATGPARTDVEGDLMLDDPSVPDPSPDLPQGGPGEVQIGISIEPAAEVEAKVTQLKAEQAARSSPAAPATKGVDTKALAKNIISHAFNYLSSFGSEEIPLKAFEAWWRKFEGRVDRDPSFLERAQE
ncbi:hypothetical protein BDZ85DRAFT_256891 [Elsinoe ampelina]|uniref:Uncharacterized protein n=1 Tax=Elsinoe ampelina TaxID=302913 RepID=A0A6A6GM58_9PEZI|nr:hypothetical protein BDZ85DRAFT_256891 [Elsinoe ampelina]